MMKKRLSNRNKLNNKGLSLVEVLVAMLVLSLTAIAFLSSFSYSVDMNRKAKVKQHALNLSQSLMESVKAYDLDTLDTQFGTGTAAANFKVYPLGTTGQKAVAGSGSPSRTYQLQNIEFNGYYYDAVVSTNPTTKKAALITAEDANKFNDAIFKQSPEEMELISSAVCTDLYLAGGDMAHIGVYDESCIKLNSRQMVMTITDTTVYMQAIYDYTITDMEYVLVGGETAIYNGTGSCLIDYQTAYSPAQYYDNAVTSSKGAQLENIYYYYYPMYDIGEAGYLECENDELKIVNNSSLDRDIYLIKQKNTILGPGWLNNAENGYSLDISYSSSTGKKVNLYHNVEESLTGAGNPILNISVVDSANVIDKGLPWKEATDETVLVYDIDVVINEHGKTEEICRLEGTTNAK